MAKILIVDDEKSIRYTLRDILEYEKYEVDEAKDGLEALDLLRKNSYDVVLCDVKMPNMDGLELLTKAGETGTEAQFIMISAHGNIETAVEATKKGAFDFIPKPPDLNRLLITGAQRTRQVVAGDRDEGAAEKDFQVVRHHRGVGGHPPGKGFH
jgi:DNA-binding NtrC family response regulator